jgi:hypothetical protein
MSGELAKRGNYDIAALNNLAADLGSVQQSITASTGAPYLKMGKDGKWGFGQDDTPVEPTSLWAINPMGVSQGAVCWTKYDDTSKTNISTNSLGRNRCRSKWPACPARTKACRSSTPWGRRAA